MRDNRFECGCERGGDCTKTTMCFVQDMAERIEELEAALEHCAVRRLCSHCEAAVQGTDNLDELQRRYYANTTLTPERYRELADND